MSLQQDKKDNFFSKESSSPRFKFNKRFPLTHGNSTQWRPFIPKERGLIHMDIGGHPPIPLAQNKIIHLGKLSVVFWVPSF